MGELQGKPRAGRRVVCVLVHVYDKLFIDGRWVEPSGRGTLEVVDSATEAVYATIPDGDPADVDRAVTAASAAFPRWSGRARSGARQAPAPRGGGARGAPRRARHGDRARSRDAEAPVAERAGRRRHLRVLGRSRPRGHATTSRTTGNGLVVREPIGVVGCITPWNYPLNQIGAKVGYTLAAGCTVVLKPSEVAPVNAFVLAEVMDGVGFPTGVFNLVSGVGPVAARRSPPTPTST